MIGAERCLRLILPGDVNRKRGDEIMQGARLLRQPSKEEGVQVLMHEDGLVIHCRSKFRSVILTIHPAIFEEEGADIGVAGQVIPGEGQCPGLIEIPAFVVIREMDVDGLDFSQGVDAGHLNQELARPAEPGILPLDGGGIPFARLLADKAERVAGDLVGQVGDAVDQNLRGGDGNDFQRSGTGRNGWGAGGFNGKDGRGGFRRRGRGARRAGHRKQAARQEEGQDDQEDFMAHAKVFLAEGGEGG